jgi:Ribbon-helix-helix protein, copG family
MAMKLELKRTNVYLAKQQLKLLRREAAKKRTSVAELIRRILDEHFETE